MAIGHTATVGATDTVHDMGGMHGFGPVEVEPDEPVFHEPWERRVFGLMIVSGAKRLRKGQLRPAIEAIPAPEYLEASYYERWLRAVEAGIAAGGSLSRSDIDARVAAPVPELVTGSRQLRRRRVPSVR